jgi:hypothetical protein
MRRQHFADGGDMCRRTRAAPFGEGRACRAIVAPGGGPASGTGASGGA